MSPTIVSALAALTLSSTAMASELAPLQAGTYELGGYVASVYYTTSGENYQVVTTIAPDRGRDGAPMRFVASLDAGERQVISVGGFQTSSAPKAIELTHQGDHLTVTPVTTQIAFR